MATTNPGWTDGAYTPRTTPQEQVTEKAKRRGEIRRRIEDIHQAAQLEDEWQEVWDVARDS